VEAGVTQELRPGLAASAAFFRHWFGNAYATTNTVLKPSDYNSYCLNAPSDARLPNGGGNQICGLFDSLPPPVFGSGTSEVTFAKNFGDQQEVYSGVDLNINARLRGGAFVQGGASIGPDHHRHVLCQQSAAGYAAGERRQRQHAAHRRVLPCEPAALGKLAESSSRAPTICRGR
jgi:hypothetical protein